MSAWAWLLDRDCDLDPPFFRIFTTFYSVFEWEGLTFIRRQTGRLYNLTENSKSTIRLFNYCEYSLGMSILHDVKN